MRIRPEVDLSHSSSDALLAQVYRFRLILLGSIVVTLLLGFNGQWQIEIDSALYLSLARNLYRGLGFTYHAAPHGLVYPGFPAALSLLFRWFPHHSIAACDALSMVAGLASLGLTYRLISLAVDRQTAVVITVLLGLSHEFFSFCFQIMPESLFLSGVMAMFCGHEALFRRPNSRWWDWGLFVAGAVIVICTKPMMLVLLPACVITMPWTRGRARRSAVATAVLAALAAGFVLIDPRHPFTTGASASYEHLAVRDVLRLPGQWQTILSHNIVELLGKSVPVALLGTPLGPTVIGAMFAVPVLLATIWLWRFRPLWGIWATATIAKSALLFSHDRYLMPILPLLIFGEWQLLRGSIARLPSRFRPAVFTLGLMLITLPNLGATAIKIVEQHRTPFLSAYRGGRFAAFAEAAADATADTPTNAVLISPDATSREFTFLADRDVFEPPLHQAVDPLRPRFILRPVDPVDPAFEAFLGHQSWIPVEPPLNIARSTRGCSWELYRVR